MILHCGRAFSGSIVLVGHSTGGMMVAGREREALVAHIVALAAEVLTLEELGREVLPSFERMIGAGRLLLYSSSGDQPFVSIAGSNECLPEYVAEFAATDPVQHFLQRENPPIFTGTRWREWKDFRSSVAYQNFYDRWDLSWLFHMRLNQIGHMEPGYAAIVCGRTAKQSDFEDVDLRVAATVLPALQAAVRRSGRVAARLSSAAAVEALFERGQARAVLALDLRGQILWMSVQAEKLLAPYLGGRRTLPDSLSSAARRLAAISRGEAEGWKGRSSFSLAIAGKGGASLEAELYLARTGSGEPFVAVDLGGAGAPPALFEIARQHGLTRAEAEILSDLVRGQSDADIAGRRFVSIPTVRTHVTRVIQKFGVHSRLQAVAYALGTAPKNQ
jgi:DNA-binding CsgD family transcriptional regulator